MWCRDRASYLESSILDTTVTQVRMDTAVETNYNQGQAVLVEECRCPPGYIGLSCDVIHFQILSGYLGRCGIKANDDFELCLCPDDEHIQIWN